jgi:hypothetical protein
MCKIIATGPSNIPPNLRIGDLYFVNINGVQTNTSVFLNDGSSMQYIQHPPLSGATINFITANIQTQPSLASVTHNALYNTINVKLTVGTNPLDPITLSLSESFWFLEH